MSTFCSLPWIHLATHPHGGVTLCCVSDHRRAKNRARNYIDGVDNLDDPALVDLNSSSIDQVMNSDYFKEVRLQMLSGFKPEACMRCYKDESNGIRSKRLIENEKFNFTEDMANEITCEDGAIPVNLRFVELRLGNLCNLKCRTCNPASSTQWRKEYNIIQERMPFVTKYNWTIDTSWTESERFWEDLLTNSKDLQTVYINGGEPTLVEKHWHYLERLIQHNLHEQVTLWYNINMTNLPDKLLDLWKKFKRVQVSCSIDDLRLKNEYIRSGTKWNDVIKNLDKLQSTPNIEVSVCQTVGWMNILGLPEFHDFMAQRKLHVHMNFVYDPAFLSAQILPQHIKDVILEHCSTLEQWKIDMLRSYINKEISSHTINDGIEFNKWIDMSRRTEYTEIFPEMAKLISDYRGQ